MLKFFFLCQSLLIILLSFMIFHTVHAEMPKEKKVVDWDAQKFLFANKKTDTWHCYGPFSAWAVQRVLPGSLAGPPDHKGT